jgi:hypothetical protein
VPKGFSLGAVGGAKLKGFVEAAYLGRFDLSVMDLVKKISGIKEALTFISGSIFRMKGKTLNVSIADLSCAGKVFGCRIVFSEIHV